MKLFSRKTTFQLTPLLDLLLIVIFAQYMEMKQASARQEEWFNAEAQGKIDAAERSAADESERARQALQNLAAALERIDRFDERQAEFKEEFDRTAAQRDALAEFTATVFKLPEDVVAKLLDERQLADNPQLKQTIEEFQKGNVREAIKHVMSFAEILKRCDLWEVYLDYLPAEKIPKATITVGTQRYELDAVTGDQFRAALYERYKQLPQPKGLVIVLFGYEHGQLPFGVRKSFSDALRDAVQRMNDDSLGRTRFYSSDLGNLLGIIPAPTSE